MDAVPVASDFIVCFVNENGCKLFLIVCHLTYSFVFHIQTSAGIDMKTLSYKFLGPENPVLQTSSSYHPQIRTIGILHTRDTSD